jgi:hypothetical protein
MSRKRPQARAARYHSALPSGPLPPGGTDPAADIDRNNVVSLLGDRFRQHNVHIDRRSVACLLLIACPPRTGAS